MDTKTAVAVARSANDELAAAVRRHPTRFSGMVAVAPQDPAAAAKEIERGITQLGLTGVIINSHTKGEYLSDPKFWEIFEAAEANNTPIYLHPNTPPVNMIQPFLECGLDGAIYYPYQHAVDEVLALDNMDMSAEDKNNFFQCNAEKAFNLT
jgi:2,3-dihydroxybenzoate decarboxylase